MCNEYNIETKVRRTEKTIEQSILKIEVEAKGNFIINKKFGRQFSVKEYKESPPASIYGIEKYLGSGLIEGIGPKFAKQIVERFRENTTNTIENEPMKLLGIPKIGERRIQAIVNSWQKHKNIKDLMIFLSDCGVSTSVAHKIYKVYGEESIQKLKENPYGIVDDTNMDDNLCADVLHSCRCVLKNQPVTKQRHFYKETKQ